MKAGPIFAMETQSDRIPCRVLYLTNTERKAQIYFEALRRRYESVVLHYDSLDCKTFTFMYAENGEARSQVVKLPSTSHRKIQLMYMWWKVWREIRRQARVRKFDVCVAEALQTTLCCMSARRLGMIRRLVYYVMDWFPNKPFSQRLDRFCCSRADETWDYTEEIAAARESKWGRLPCRHQLILPALYGPRDNVDLDGKSVERAVCYVGAIRREAGLDALVRAVSLLKARGDRIDVRIMGAVVDKESIDAVRRLVEEHDVSDQVHYLGYVSDEQMVEAMNKSLCGICFTPNGKENYSNYAIPGKIREYVENGLPVILSKGNPMERELVSRGAALSISDSAEELADAIKFFADHLADNGEYRRKAYGYAQEMSNGNPLYENIEKLM